MDRFKWCYRTRKHIWNEWKQECEYIYFTDKIKLKEAADKDMVLKARVKP